MGLGAGERDDPAKAVAFWVRFWDDRGIEFRAAAVRSAVQRLVRYRSASRAADLRELDTFALPDIFLVLEVPRDAAGIEIARPLVDIIAHATGETDVLATSDLEAARACVQRWRHWWTVHRSDYTLFSGVSRISAVVVETRYGKWALGAVTERFGRVEGGTPVLEELAHRGPVTLVLCFGAIALAYLLAIPLGALSAAFHGRRLDLAIAAIVLGAYAIPSAVIAVAVATLASTYGGLLLPTLVLALGLVAAPTRHQRSSLLTVLSRDYMRAAVARGAGPVRVIAVHGLRNAILPVLTLAALEPPLALGGAFVVERVFHLHGLGEATIRAVQDRDVSFLMAISLVAAAMVAALVIVTDLVSVALDRRLEQAVLTRSAP
jgi:ABC-type dipeptide/oligopeptide/nickel transport system permease component